MELISTGHRLHIYSNTLQNKRFCNKS